MADDLDLAPRRIDAGMPDYSDPGGDDFVALARDRVLVRSLQEGDLRAVVRIDRQHTGRDRTDYYRRKLREMMSETGVRVSLVGEVDGAPVGFVMARVDYGAFGRAEPTAVVDTIGVDAGFARHGVAQALLSQLFANLATLHVETVRTMITWDNFGLLRFMARSGFRPAQRLVLTRAVR